MYLKQKNRKNGIFSILGYMWPRWRPSWRFSDKKLFRNQHPAIKKTDDHLTVVSLSAKQLVLVSIQFDYASDQDDDFLEDSDKTIKKIIQKLAVNNINDWSSLNVCQFLYRSAGWI